MEKKVDERIDIQREREEQPTSSNRMVFVSQIPRKLAKDFLVMLFENKRVGGGKVEELDLDPVQGTAVVTFEDPKSAYKSFINRLNMLLPNFTVNSCHVLILNFSHYAIVTLN